MDAAHDCAGDRGTKDQAVADANAELEAKIALLASELGEARAAQAATADVLKVISRSAFDLQSVLQTLIASASNLCGASTSGIYMQDGDLYRLAAGYRVSPAHWAFEQAHPSKVGRDSWVGRTALTKTVLHVPDISLDHEHQLPDAPKIGGFAAVLCVPLIREGSVIGVIGLTRTEPGPFTLRQIELVESFADQAVIAIENVRLFEEVQVRNRELAESLEQQTATSEILRVISKSPTDIQPVLNAVAKSAAQICDAYDAVIFLTEGPTLAVAAHHGPIPVDITHSPIGRGWVTGRAVADRVPIHVHDLQAAGAEFPGGQAMALRFRHRTTLAVPLLREDEAIGALMIRRSEVRPFSDKQIELLKTFADQAVIAIQNVRLFEEVQARNREVTEALERQTATAEVLKTISSAAFVPSR
jgi:two-component system NtrC family sensor kinase